VEKLRTAGQATDDNMAHVHCMLHTSGYKFTHVVCNDVLLFYPNNGCTNAPQFYVSRILPVLYGIKDIHIFYQFCNFMNTKYSFLSYVKRSACTRPQKELVLRYRSDSE
jgi:hypothetical protein